MSTREENGIVYFDEPAVVKYLEFAYQHLNCDSIAVRDTVFEPYQTQIVAYASSKEFNPVLNEVFQEKYGKEQYAVMRHISEVEAYSID